MNGSASVSDAVEVRPGGIRATWHWVRSDPKRVAMGILWIAVLSHVVVLLVMSRGWFFTNDDWDYLTRDGIAEILRPHAGHITAWVAGLAQGIKPIAGLDYWPAYPAVIAILWSSVPLVAFWVWRRSGTDAIPSAIGAAVLAWIATSAFIQFAHVSVIFALLTLILVVPIDEKCVCPKHVAAGFGLSMVAVLAGSTGVLVTASRAAVAAGYRRWNGVISAVPALVIYYFIRSAVVTSSTDISFGVGDIPTILRIIFRAIGEGLRALFFLPAGLESVMGALLLVVTIVVLIRARFSFRVTTWIVSGAAYIFTVAVVRFLNRPVKMDMLLSGELNLGSITPVRWANTPVILLIVASLPMVAAWAKGAKARWRVAVTVSAILLFLGGSVAQTVLTYDRISDKSVVKAAEAETFVQLVSAGEPFAEPRDQTGKNGHFFTVGAVDGFASEGLIEGMLGSEIYTVRQFDPLDEGYTRGILRFTTSRPGKVSTWAEVGMPGVKGCMQADESLTFEVSSAVVILLELDEDHSRTEWAELTWSDEFGLGRMNLVAADFDESGSMKVRTAAILEDRPPARLTITGPGLSVCLKGG